MASDSLTALISSSPAGTGSFTPAASSLTGAKKVMDKEDFLKLLITQLRYQDPMAPQDPKDFVAQLAQFSSLEQQMNANQNLAGLGKVVQGLQDSLGLSRGVALLGKMVKGVGNGLPLSGGRAPAASYQLSADAKEVQVAILNAGGQTVRTLKLGSQSAGVRQFTWDGKDDQGRLLADGSYTFQVSAKDSQGKSLTVVNYFTGKVQEVYKYTQGVWVRVDGRQVKVDDIVSVGPAS